MGGLIWLTSYPKSGNTWMRIFLHNLLSNSEEPFSLDKLTTFCIGEVIATHYHRRLSKPWITIGNCAKKLEWLGK